MFAPTISLAVQNLMLHKLRSFLTMLGTILGVSSVISMLAIGEGSKQEAVEAIRELGATNVIIRSVKPEYESEGSGAPEGATQEQTNDYDRLTSTMWTVERAIPIALVRGNAQRGRHRILNARILGTTPEYLEVKNLSVRRGRFLTQTDLQRTSNIAVLAAGAAQNLFSFEDPIGKILLLGPGAYTIVGVLDTQASGSATPGAIDRQDFNDDIYIPITAAQRRFGELQMIVRAGGREFERTQLSEITLTVREEKYVSQTANMARKLLDQTHTKGDDFEIQVPLELLNQAEKEKWIWNVVLGSIAGISLLVGGIGIMNIMLATVTERTREIGVRRAIGAKRRDIMRQFLVETVVLSTIGGLLGIFLGVVIPVLVTLMAGITTALSLWAIMLAFGISVSIGIIFGMYPARRAALMDPIEALRHE